MTLKSERKSNKDETIGSISGKNAAFKENDGKRQSTFFLTDKALESLKSCMETVDAPSLNHALEFILLELGNEIGKEKSVFAGSSPKVIKQAAKITEQYEKLISKPKSNRKKEEVALYAGLNELQQLLRLEKSTS